MSDKTATVYKNSDFVDVVDEQGNDLAPIPKRWLGTDLVPAGVKKKSGSKSAKKDDDDDVVIPEGAPTEDWTHAQLDAYAAKQDPPVDVSGASNKAEKLELLAPAE